VDTQTWGAPPSVEILPFCEALNPTLQCRGDSIEWLRTAANSWRKLERLGNGRDEDPSSGTGSAVRATVGPTTHIHPIPPRPNALVRSLPTRFHASANPPMRLWLLSSQGPPTHGLQFFKRRLVRVPSPRGLIRPDQPHYANSPAASSTHAASAALILGTADPRHVGIPSRPITTGTH